MKEITLIKTFGSILIFTAIVGAIIHTWLLWPKARQEWKELLNNKGITNEYGIQCPISKEYWPGPQFHYYTIDQSGQALFWIDEKPIFENGKWKAGCAIVDKH